MIPFTRTDFLRVFEQYNDAVWPWHALIYLVGLIAFALAFTRRAIASRLISLILALLWLWMGIVYHLLFFTTINKAARLFGSLFIIQSVVFIFVGVLSSRLSFRFRCDVQGLIGGALITYALVVYPIIGILLGHQYPAAPTFGVPCPTTIFTFGLLIGAGVNLRFYMLVIPLLWSVIGLWAAISLGMYEDLGLVIAGFSGVIIMLNCGTPAGQSWTKHNALNVNENLSSSHSSFLLSGCVNIRPSRMPLRRSVLTSRGVPSAVSLRFENSVGMIGIR